MLDGAFRGGGGAREAMPRQRGRHGATGARSHTRPPAARPLYGLGVTSRCV